MPTVLCLTAESDKSECGLFTGLPRKGFTPIVLGSISEELGSMLRSAGIEIVPFSFRSKLDLKAIRELKALIARYEPALVHAFTGRAVGNSLWALKGRDIPLVTYRGTMGHLSWWDPSSWLTFLNGRISAIVCVSRAVKEYLLSCGVPPHKLHVIYKGHLPEWYKTTQADLEAFGIPSSSRVVCANANMRPVKGIDVLINAAAELPKDGSIHYLLIGEVRDKKIPALVRSLGLSSLIHFTGYRKDALSLMARADVVAVPSRAREGFPKALIEAMLMKRPVVASAVGGIPEMITQGEEGFLVAPEDPHALASSLQKILADPAAATRMGEKGREKVIRDFSIERTVAETADLYTNLLSR